MNIVSKVFSLLSLTAIAAMAQTARADSSDAMCEFYKDGDQQQNRSGPCTFSQRQGYIDIDLRNGNSYSLAPGNKADQFTDQKGNQVERTRASGNSQVFKWKNKEITVTFSDNNTAQQGSQHAAGGHGETDSFKTVCGVIVGGKNYRYRCTVEDHYRDGDKTSTTLRYPDQTINMVWKPGNHVELHFEGMVPKSARYATSEGETNFVFEDKTYFYYSDKEVARREVEHFPE
jgi:hypothetical protein